MNRARDDDRRKRDRRSRSRSPRERDRRKRSRSRSPRERRRRSRSRSRSRDRGERRRDRSPDRRTDKVEGRSNKLKSAPLPIMIEPVDVDFGAGVSEAELQMMRDMGIPVDFDSTAGKHIEDPASNAGAVKTETKRSARQYMNRKGGFNRPLPAEVTGKRVMRD